MKVSTITYEGEHRRQQCKVVFAPSVGTKMKWLATMTVDGQEFAPILVDKPPSMEVSGRLLDQLMAYEPKRRVKTEVPRPELKIVG